MQMQDLTSDRIIAFLNSHPPSNVSEIAGALLLTSADIRYHLKHLLSIGLVSRTIKQIKPGAGRPSNYYAPSTHGTESGYLLLANICARIFLDESDALAQSNIDRIVNEICRNHPEEGNPGTQRLNNAVQNLIRMGYQAAWEARPDHPVMILRNCPYLELVLDQPGICEMDKLLIQKLTGWKTEAFHRIRDNARKIPDCRFVLHNE